MSFWKRWLRIKELKHQRKIARRKDLHGGLWEILPATRNPYSIEEPTPEPEAPQTWFQFCVDRSNYYLSRREPEAAMIYWVMRYIDDDDPCTEEGERDLQEYWDYKASWYEAMQMEKR